MIAVGFFIFIFYRQQKIFIKEKEGTNSEKSNKKPIIGAPVQEKYTSHKPQVHNYIRGALRVRLQGRSTVLTDVKNCRYVSLFRDPIFVMLDPTMTVQA